MQHADWLYHLALSAGRQADVGADFGLFGIKVPRFIRKAASTVGSPFRVAGRVVRRGSGVIGRQLARVPVVGPGLHAVYALGPAGPVNLAANIASGKRIDRAAYDALKERIKAYQDVAPYVQTVISFVPGVGQGLSGAIGAANALSKGQPITQALIEATRGAIPGGPVAAAAFDVAVAGVQGKPLSEVALSAIPLPPEQKKYVIAAVQAAGDIAAGKRVDEAVYQRGVSLLPKEAQGAIQIGVAIAQGKKLQEIAAHAVAAAAPKLGEIGEKLVAASPMLKAGALAIGKARPDITKGFNIGTGFLQHKVTPTTVSAIRSALPKDQKKGFDIAASVHMGRMMAPKTHIPPNQQFGYYATHGMQGAKPQLKVAMMKTIASSHPELRVGASSAIKNIHNTSGLWARLVRWVNKLSN